MSHIYFRGAHGAIIVTDGTREETFDGALRWKHQVDNKVLLPELKPIPSILLVNKVREISSIFYCTITQNKGKERENSYQHLKISP